MRFSNYGFPAVFQKGHNKGMCMGLVSFYPGPPKCSLFSSISYDILVIRNSFSRTTI